MISLLTLFGLLHCTFVTTVPSRGHRAEDVAYTLDEMDKFAVQFLSLCIFSFGFKHQFQIEDSVRNPQRTTTILQWASRGNRRI